MLEKKEMRANKYSIETIFNEYSKLEIPFFQRKYVWDKDLWEKYLNAMLEVSNPSESREYFMGTIVLKKESGLSSENNFIIIDGQQRLITTLLFFKAFHERKGIQGFSNTNNEILKVSRDDEGVFDKILKSEFYKLTDKDKKSSLISKCYDYFSETDVNKFKKINLNKIKNKVCFVAIELTEKQDEQRIFDTLNSVGVPLTTAELLKNNLFRGRDLKTRESYKKFWEDSFEGQNLEFWEREAGRGGKPNIEVFLLAFFDVYNKDSQSPEYSSLGALASKYRHFFDSNGIGKECEARTNFLDFLKIYENHYHQKIDSARLSKAMESTKENFDASVDRINIVIHRMNHMTILPYILYILQNVENDIEKGKIISCVESYVIRRAICKLPASYYTLFFHGLVRSKINTYEKLNGYMCTTIKKGSAHNRFPKDEELKKSFRGENGHLSSSNAKAVLYIVEQSLFNRKYSFSLIPYDKYQVEHILPRTWKKNWKNFGTYTGNDDEKDIYLKNNYINKLGNLTLITGKLNVGLSNKSWIDKRRELSKYAKVISIEKYFESDVWDEEQIDGRTRDLYEQAIKIWPEPTGEFNERIYPIEKRHITFYGKKIYKLRKDNPRQEGTWGYKSWELVKDGMTYEEYKAAGGRQNDLKWDLDHGWVELVE